jgi:hypothetical protein
MLYMCVIFFSRLRLLLWTEYSSTEGDALADVQTELPWNLLCRQVPEILWSGKNGVLLQTVLAAFLILNHLLHMGHCSKMRNRSA